MARPQIEVDVQETVDLDIDDVLGDEENEEDLEKNKSRGGESDESRGSNGHKGRGKGDPGNYEN